jgi:hypothetical protein
MSEAERFVVHLTVAAADLAAAHVLARALARSLGFLPQVQVGETTVSLEGDPTGQHPVFCDRRLPHRRRCLLRPGHVDDCTPRLRFRLDRLRVGDMALSHGAERPMSPTRSRGVKRGPLLYKKR